MPSCFSGFQKFKHSFRPFGHGKLAALITDGPFIVSASKDGVVHFPAIPVILMKII